MDTLPIGTEVDALGQLIMGGFAQDREALAEEDRANPNHDKKGRFAKAASTATHLNSEHDKTAEYAALMNDTKPAYFPDSSEARASRPSKVERRIVKKAKICERCRLNDDPNKVPVHPNCDCDVITDSLETGVADPHSRFLSALSTQDLAMEVVSAEGLDLPAGIQLNSDTVAIIDGDSARFADLSRWLEQIEPYLDQGSQFLSIVVDDDSDEAVQQVQETVGEIADDVENLPEALRNRKLWFALAKSVVF